MSICFIESPPFVVDFRQFVSQEGKQADSFLKRIQSSAATALQWVALFFIAFAQSVYRVIRSIPFSFRYTVLDSVKHYFTTMCLSRNGAYFLLAIPYLFLFKTVFWGGAMGLSLITTTVSLFWEKTHSGPSLYLKEFAGEEIDIRHIQTKEADIDVSAVPNTVTVDTLLEIFDTINFTDKNRPGYMPHLSRKEGPIVYTPQKLREHLQTFIHNVNNRIAFLGTPPAYNLPRLMEFYQQIENAVRFSVHKVNHDLALFRQEHGEDVNAYTESQKREYQNLLEDQSRIAIDLAIAGNHCGGRYMGDAMSTYYSCKKEDLSGETTLQDHLIEVLAQKRKEIANQHIQTFLGTDTHAFTNYMANLGQPLGIPGTKNVSEHIARPLNCDLHLRHFFEEYTVDFIIDAIQEEIKKSGKLRDKLIDWLANQPGDWNKEIYGKQAEELFQRISSVLQESEEQDSVLTENFNYFFSVIAHVQSAKIDLPSFEGGWDFFLQELFALDEVKRWFNIKFSNLNPMALVKRKHEIRRTGSEEILGKEMIKELQENLSKNIPIKSNPERLFELQKIRKVQQIFPLRQETIERIFQGKADLKTAIDDRLDLSRRREFLGHFDLESIKDQGISDKLLEWLLVSQGIFRLQGGS